MHEWFYYTGLALAIVLIVLGSIVTGKASSTQKDVKNAGMGVLVIGLIFLAGSGFSIFHKMGGTSKLYYF